MRALLIAFVLALATVVPVFAGDGGDDYRPLPPTIEIGAPAA